VNVRVTHHKSGVSLIEAVAFEDLKNLLAELHSKIVVDRMVNRMIEEIDMLNIKRAINIVYEVKDGRIL
jgi:hypothetical protein